MDWQAMARVAWSRKSRLASWTGLGLGLVDSTRPVLGEVIKPFRCCQRQAQNYQPHGNIDLQNLSHARPPARCPHDDSRSSSRVMLAEYVKSRIAALMK
jgi:hypothetical protein